MLLSYDVRYATVPIGEIGRINHSIGVQNIAKFHLRYVCTDESLPGIGDANITSFDLTLQINEESMSSA